MQVQMLRITGCSNSSFWYAGKIGAVVPHLGYDAGEYITREPSGYVNIVKCADAELVDVVPSAPTCVPTAGALPVTYRVVIDVMFTKPDQLTRFDPKLLEQEVFQRLCETLNFHGLDVKVTFG